MKRLLYLVVGVFVASFVWAASYSNKASESREYKRKAEYNLMIARDAQVRENGVWKLVNEIQEQDRELLEYVLDETSKMQEENIESVLDELHKAYETGCENGRHQGRFDIISGTLTQKPSSQ